MLNETNLGDYLERQRDIDNLAFHPWRFVSESIPAFYNLEGPGNHYQMGDVQKGSFHTLDDATTILGHTVVDIMKFDIEDYKWFFYWIQ
jgi:hypothetical protein